MRLIRGTRYTKRIESGIVFTVRTGRLVIGTDVRWDTRILFKKKNLTPLSPDRVFLI